MKINKFNAIFQDPALRTVLLGNKPNQKKIKKNEIHTNLFQSVEKEKYLPLYLEAIMKAQKHHKSFSNKQLKQFESSYSKIQQSVTPQCQAAINKIKGVSQGNIGQPIAPLHANQFPSEARALKDVQERAKQLRANNFEEGAKLIEKVKSLTKKDPSINALVAKDAKLSKYADIASSSNPPFDFNRTGRDMPGVYLNASDVTTPRQNYILAGLVRTVNCAKNYFDAALAQKTRVFVSLQERSEAKSRCNGFWENKVLSQITLRDGSKMKNIASNVIATGNAGAKIIESTLEISKNGQKRTVTHLHYEGWHDKTAIPDEQLFRRLLDRIDELNPLPSTPIAINCKGGVGRTGTTAVAHYLRKEINAELALGKKLDAIRINVPDVIYAFRKQRRSLVGQPSQFSQIYSTIAAYYEKKKALPAAI